MALAGDHVQVLVGGYELTGDLNAVQFQEQRQMLPAVAFGEAVEKSVGGRRQSQVTHTGYLNAQAARAHPVLHGVSVEQAVSVLVGNNAAPTVGSLAYSLAIRQQQYQVLPKLNEVIPFNATFAPRGQAGGWGVALTPPTTLTNTTNGSSVDHGAATTRGGSAYLHILQTAASDTYTLTVQGSNSGAFSGEETTLATFTLNASALGAERLGIAGTLPRYTRYRAVRTGSAGNPVKLAVILVRE
jgi:hypothetical protein